MNVGYTPRDLLFGSDGREKLTSGISKISKAVKSTLGPNGQTVLIESPEHLRGITVTKDGVTVAKSVHLIDPVENLAVQMMRDAADNTATIAGDGTTTSIVIAEQIAKEGMQVFESDHTLNKTEILRHISSMCEEVISDLCKRSTKLTKRKMKDVATISSNNDIDLGNLITEAYSKVGRDGVVTVENSQSESTYIEVTNGIKFKRGYTSGLFVNDQKNDDCVMDDVYVLMTDHLIDRPDQIEGVLREIVSKRLKLLIIGNMSEKAINTLAANVVKNGLSFCNVQPPQFGYKMHELMSDIAIIRGENKTDDIPKRVSDLNDQIKITKNKADKNFIQERIAALSGGVGVIYAGGNSDVEQKERYDRIEDAVCAVKSALEEGIIGGGGVPLLRCSSTVLGESLRSDDVSISTAAWILAKGLKAPFLQILDNSGIDSDVVMDAISWSSDNCPFNYGMNVKTGEYGDLISMGVIDPLKVTKNALKNAVSVATTILSTDAILTMARSYEK
jgi:chaperonin GroEL